MYINTGKYYYKLHTCEFIYGEIYFGVQVQFVWSPGEFSDTDLLNQGTNMTKIDSFKSLSQSALLQS